MPEKALRLKSIKKRHNRLSQTTSIRNAMDKSYNNTQCPVPGINKIYETKHSLWYN